MVEAKDEKESDANVVLEEEEMEAAVDKTENNVIVEDSRMEGGVTKDERKEVNVDKVKKNEDKMDVELPIKEQVKADNHMHTTSNIDSSTTTNSSAVNNLAVTVSKVRLKSEPYHCNPEPIDDDLSLPSSKELSNQVLSNNLLRDIENLSDNADGRSISKVLSRPLIPSCSAFRSSVLSNVTSTVKSGSSLSVSGKQSMKDTVMDTTMSSTIYFEQ